MNLGKCVRFILVVGYSVLSMSIMAEQNSVHKDNGSPSMPDMHVIIKAKYIESFGSDTSTSQTDVSNARVKATGSLSPDTDYGLQIDTVRDDVLLDAWVRHSIVSGLSVKAGQFKTPYGTDNLVSSHKMAFVSRSLIKKHAAPHCRDRGVVTALSHRNLDVLAGIMNGSGQNKADFNNGKSFSCRTVMHVLQGLDVSGNYYTGKIDPAGGGTETFYDFDVHGSRGGWEYAIEYSHRDGDDDSRYAAYAYAAYDIPADLDWLVTLTPAFRTETCDPGDDVFRRYTAGLTLHFTRKYTNRLMINYEWYGGEYRDSDDALSCEFLVYH